MNFSKRGIFVKATLAVVIMIVMAFIGYIVESVLFTDISNVPILFVLISGIACIIQAIDHKPHDTEK